MSKTGMEIGKCFASVVDVLPGCSEVRVMREELVASLQCSGLPHRRMEEWRYTDLRSKWSNLNPISVRSVDFFDVCDSDDVDLEDRLRIRMLNGHLTTAIDSLKLPSGLLIQSLSSAFSEEKRDNDLVLEYQRLAGGDFAFDLNFAFMTDGIIINVDDEVCIQQTVELSHLMRGVPALSTVRSVVILGKGASLTLVEFIDITAEGHQWNDVLQVILNEGAKFSHIRYSAKDESAVSLSTMCVYAGENTEINSFTFGVPSNLSRRRIDVALNGNAAKASFAGLNLLRGKTHSDTFLVVRHNAPTSESNEFYRAVVDDEAKSVFQGKLIVKPQAQHAAGNMLSNCLLLSGAAEVINKPELEIFADDVRCAHGATCGSLCEVALFFIMSRGIPRKVAEGMLIKAFMSELVEKLLATGTCSETRGYVREAIVSELDVWIAARGM